jgi:hypothetical protein
VEGLQLKGFVGKKGLLSSSVVFLRVAVGNTAYETGRERYPCEVRRGEDEDEDEDGDDDVG